MSFALINRDHPGEIVSGGQFPGSSGFSMVARLSEGASLSRARNRNVLLKILHVPEGAHQSRRNLIISFYEATHISALLARELVVKFDFDKHKFSQIHEMCNVHLSSILLRKQCSVDWGTSYEITHRIRIQFGIMINFPSWFCMGASVVSLRNTVFQMFHQRFINV